MSKTVHFDLPELEDGSDTDYEDENPQKTFLKLIKGLNNPKIEEFGDDYQSSVELRRKAELAFNYGQELVSQKDLEMSFPPKDPLELEKKNNIKKIMGKDFDQHQQPCPKCSEIMVLQYNHCQVCSRETVDIRCQICVPDLFDLCSKKCQDIFDGNNHVIEITNKEGKPFIIIEDDENLALRVTDHKIFYSELSQKDLNVINKPCLNCQKDDPDANKDANKKNDPDANKDGDIYGDIYEDNIQKIGVAPMKCEYCNENYSYMVTCLKCFKESGLKYICDECEG